jgi:hypothetical protein
MEATKNFGYWDLVLFLCKKEPWVMPPALYIQIASCIWAELHRDRKILFSQHTHFVSLHQGIIDRRWRFTRRQIVGANDSITFIEVQWG